MRRRNHRKTRRYTIKMRMKRTRTTEEEKHKIGNRRKRWKIR